MFSFTIDNISLSEIQITLFLCLGKKDHLDENQKVDFERKHIRPCD